MQSMTKRLWCEPASIRDLGVTGLGGAGQSRWRRRGARGQVGVGKRPCSVPTCSARLAMTEERTVRVLVAALALLSATSPAAKGPMVDVDGNALRRAQLDRATAARAGGHDLALDPPRLARRGRRGGRARPTPSPSTPQAGSSCAPTSRSPVQNTGSGVRSTRPEWCSTCWSRAGVTRALPSGNSASC